jgi:hypothetical protein
MMDAVRSSKTSVLTRATLRMAFIMVTAMKTSSLILHSSTTMTVWDKTQKCNCQMLSFMLCKESVVPIKSLTLYGVLGTYLKKENKLISVFDKQQGILQILQMHLQSAFFYSTIINSDFTISTIIIHFIHTVPRHSHMLVSLFHHSS